MGVNRFFAATAAVALMAAPTVAAAQAAPMEVAPAAEVVEGEQLRGGFIIPLIALIAVILGICAATGSCGLGGDDDDLPTSP